ncbi:MAG: outer membrane protein transport protein [Gammaproteobacteria bacterium]|nr:outer membrane protein transport protein [Gammaproteobacteria bacterium]
MTRIPGWFKAISTIAGLSVAGMASATTGYFGLGYGAKAMGLAGAVVSNPQDSATVAVNPAGITEVGERVDVGLRFFNPNREAVLNTSVLGANFDVDDDSRRDLFLIPNFGFNIQLRDNLWFGFNNYGNGGMNSTYDRNLYDEAFVVLGAFGQGGAAAAAQVPEGTTTPGLVSAGQLPKASDNVGKLGVDLAQAIFAPTLALKVNNKNSLGASLLIGVQRFSARGLGNFQCFTTTVASNPGSNPSCAFGVADLPSTKLTDNNSDWSFGAGVRIGWLGEVHPNVTLGASVSSKIYMSEFDDYAELFAEQGDFDIPANFTLGATFQATPKLKVSLDYQRILYEGVNSISNVGPVASLAGPTIGPGSGPLGADNGLGFGWEDINIYRLAAEYDHNDQWTFRAGFSMNDQPIRDSQVLFNFLAPAVIEKHATVGFTYRPDKQSEWSFAYMRAFSEEVTSSQTAFGIPGAIKMDQNSVDVGYTYKF